MVTKLDRRTAVALRGNGIKTLSEFVQLSARSLARYPYAGPAVAQQLLVQAQALLSGNPIRSPQRQPALADPVLFLDLESHPQTQVPWAFGWSDAEGKAGVALVAPPRPASAPKQLVIAGVPVVFVREPATGWQHIAHLTRSQSGQIFHWGDHELHSLTRSAPPATAEALRLRLANLYELFALRYTLPIPRRPGRTAGTLKAVAGYLGQEWPAEVDWSVSWSAYSRWRHETAQVLLQRQPWSDDIDARLAPAISYLLADLEALRRVWQWLKERENEVAYE